MTETMHTPGPWRFQSSESGDVIWIGNENENAACVPGFSDHPGNVANARLIAAAPDMLEALQMIRAADDAYDLGFSEQERDEIHAVIAKATGG